MAQFNFINDLNNAIRLDDPITKGPTPRWQKKALDSTSNQSNLSLNASKGNFKSPGKELKAATATPSKTPKKSPGRLLKTPGGGDRFIPTRSAIDFELGHFKLTLDDANDEIDELKSPSQVENERAMNQNLHGGIDPSKTKILAFQEKAPAAPDGHQNSLKVVYSTSKTPAKAASRYIPQAPDRILDAPAIVDDYYLNLVDWSKSNLLAVALGNSVYLWNADTGGISQLVELPNSEYICSLNWIVDGDDMLAVGTSTGTVQLWDTVGLKKMRTMDGHSGRVASLSWNSYILSSGCRQGLIVHHDVRQRNHNVSTVEAHSQEVCGLKWSPDGKYLASGGNDNLLNIWQPQHGEAYGQPTPVSVFNAHQAAVKALSWCPWQSGILASGGGTADRRIRIWNCNTQASIVSVDTKSQVCGILWSAAYKELISGHGYANNQLIIWKYPKMTKVAELTGHTSRVLHLCMSPCGSTVLSAGADETLRLWKCFVKNPKQKKDVGEKISVDSIFKRGIR